MTGPLAQVRRRRQARAATDDVTDDVTDDMADDVTGDTGGDVADETGAAATSDAAGQKSRRRARRARRARRGPLGRFSAGSQILVLMALVALVLAIAVVSLQHRGNTLRDTDGGAQKAMYAAATAAQDLSSYDYRTLESDIKTAAGQTTGQLRADYEKQAQAIMATARQQQVVVNAQTVKSGVVSASSGEVVVLVFLNRTTSKTGGRAGGGQRTPDQLRLLMTMKKVGDRWLVAKVDVM